MRQAIDRLGNELGRWAVIVVEHRDRIRTAGQASSGIRAVQLGRSTWLYSKSEPMRPLRICRTVIK